jgi:hypothetical protein
MSGRENMKKNNRVLGLDLGISSINLKRSQRT